MRKNRIKLNENVLRGIIRESLRRIYEGERGYEIDDYFSPEDYEEAKGLHYDDIPDFDEDDEDAFSEKFGHHCEGPSCGEDECCQGGLFERRLNESVRRNLKKVLRHIH